MARNGFRLGGFGYAIDYDKAIADDLALIEACDRSDRLAALLPGMVALVGYCYPTAHEFSVADWIGYCPDLAFAARVAEVAGVSVECLLTARDDAAQESWEAWEAFRAEHGREPRGLTTAAEWRAFEDRVCIMRPEFARDVRRRARASLARHRRNKIKHGA